MTSSSNIPEAAAEAMAYALYLDANPDSEVQWFDITFHDQDELMRRAAKLLEAAAPHLASAWHDAVADAYVEGALSAAAADVLWAKNPYR